VAEHEPAAVEVDDERAACGGLAGHRPVDADGDIAGGPGTGWSATSTPAGTAPNNHLVTAFSGTRRD
jgi:hypothetical protein